MSGVVVEFPGMKAPANDTSPARHHPHYDRQTLQLVRAEFEHAARKLLIVAEGLEETVWAIRLMESVVADAKSNQGK